MSKLVDPQLGTLSLGKDLTPPAKHTHTHIRAAKERLAPTKLPLYPSPYLSSAEKGSRSKYFFQIDAIYSIHMLDTQEITILTVPNLHVFTFKPLHNCLPG